MGIICSNKSRHNRQYNQNICICCWDEEKERKIKGDNIYEELLSKEEIDKLNEFLNTNELQRDFYKIIDDNDEPFNNLKQIEETKLNEEFDKIKDKYSQNIKAKLKINFQNDNEKNNLILKTIFFENTENIYKKKIIDEINSIKVDDSKYAIEYLTINSSIC